MKFDYFDALEALALKVFAGAFDVDEAAGEIIQHLATDFITPIDRADIADIALSLRRCALLGVKRTDGKKDTLDRLCEAAEEYVRALRSLGKRGGKISAKLFFERSRAAWLGANTEEERRRVAALCRCCEALIRAVMNNI